MFQRSHSRSETPARKEYFFISRPLGLDPRRLADEIAKERPEWIESQWKWHVESRFCILRAGERQAYPGSELTQGHSVDQPSLSRLPLLRAFLDSAFPEPARVAWLGWLPHGARIFMHVDNTRHWDEHHRVHVPLITNPEARLCVAGRFLHLRSGCAWVVNNSVPHGAINRGADRLHLALDLRPSLAFEAWLSDGTEEPGQADDSAFAELSQDPLQTPSARHGLDGVRRARMLRQ